MNYKVRKMAEEELLPQQLYSQEYTTETTSKKYKQKVEKISKQTGQCNYPKNSIIHYKTPYPI